ncbi:DUF1311 domain-containing protein [Thalassococcus sp. CAU 1522]|uniref:DUF1311 domain-containing protein n=1 Tax=Thalassococcus arenae TaxID=2851652 RepID=A0ABS6NCJ9_9RHOB|nr:lysozyme inhibitor LprI family protein [Thalassococcus arenae]MBV2361698.1 DUF1311 domain-containing protein [Thalassococcus arenae]
MRFACSVLVFLLAGAAQAACPGDTQIEMNTCAAEEYRRADAALNAAWKPAKAFADGAGIGAKLLDAQRKWIAFRDAACLAEAGLYEGGSIRPLVLNSCLTRLTRQRTEDLLTLGY